MQDMQYLLACSPIYLGPFSFVIFYFCSVRLNTQLSEAQHCSVQELCVNFAREKESQSCQNIPPQFSAVLQCSAVQASDVQYIIVQCSAVQYIAVQCSPVE